MIEPIFDSISTIELNKETREPQKQAMFLTTLDEAVELEHPVRLTIIRVLRRGIPDTITNESVDDKTGEMVLVQRSVTRNALSVIEIVKMSKEHQDLQELTRNMVNHHLPKMVEMGFVRKYGTLTTGKRTTDYYQRAAKQFVVTMETPHFGREYLLIREAQRIDRTLEAFRIDLDDSEKVELVELLAESELLKDKWRSEIASLVREDVTEPAVVDMYHWLLDAYALGSKEYLDIFERIRKILFNENLEGR